MAVMNRDAEIEAATVIAPAPAAVPQPVSAIESERRHGGRETSTRLLATFLTPRTTMIFRATALLAQYIIVAGTPNTV